MEKPIACIEMGASGVKLLVGYCLNGEPYCVYRAFYPLPEAYRDGQIVDESGYAKALASFRSIQDDQAKVSIDITEANLVLPNINFLIYENESATGTTSASNEIAKLDISNVLSLVKKQPIPGNNAIVDIIPDEFILENGERYVNPPFGKKSPSLTIHAKIHTLPETLVNQYANLLQHAGYRLRAESVSTYCLAQWIKTMKELPTSYLLLDLGAKTSSVSLIGNGAPYSSQAIFMGGDDLTKMIEDGLGVSHEQAELIKRRFGYDERAISYDPSFSSFAGKGFENCDFHQSDLNAVIHSYFERFLGLIKTATASMLAKYGDRFDTLPIVCTGGASRLFGLKSFLNKLYPQREVFFARSRTIGCRDEGFGALLGMLVANSTYRGTLGETHQGMATVSRVPSKKEKAKRPSYEEDAL